MTSIGGGASDDPFTVSGNTVSVKKASSEGDYKGVKWELSDWSNAKAPKMSIEISNDTGAELKAKYKLVTDKGDCYSYPDFELAAGESSAWVTVFSENNDFSTKGATSITAIEMYLITTATSGTLSIELTFPGSNAGGNTGDPDDGGSSSTTEYKAGVMTSIGGGASDDPFTVSGNTVSVKKASSEGDYKGVKWELSDWSNAKAPKMSIEISNDTGAALKAKYKLVTDKGDCYSYPDFELAAGESSPWVTVFSENNDFSTKGATSITAIEMYLITTATSGTLSIELTFPGSNAGGNTGDPDDGGSSSTTEYKAGVMTSIGGGASDDPFTVSGNTVSVKKASSEGDYKGVKWELSDWSNAKAPKMSIEISNDTGAALKAKYKLVTDKGDCYSYPDFELAAGESSPWVTVFSENNDFSTKGATSITAIEMYLITTATSGTLSIELTFPGSNAGGNTGDPDDGGSSSTTEYKAGVMTSIGGGASDDPFTVSGNTVSVKKASSEGDYKGVKWELSDWSNAKAPKMSIEISNDTGAELKAKYKLVTDKGDCYSYPDFELAAGQSSAWETVFSENNDFSTKGATSITVIELYLITTATSGTLSIELTFPL